MNIIARRAGRATAVSLVGIALATGCSSSETANNCKALQEKCIEEGMCLSSYNEGTTQGSAAYGEGVEGSVSDRAACSIECIPCTGSESSVSCEECIDDTCDAEYELCIEAPDDACLDLYDCEQACESQSCVEDCWSEYPGGLAALDALDACLVAECETACGYAEGDAVNREAQSSGAGGAGSGGSAGEGGGGSAGEFSEGGGGSAGAEHVAGSGPGDFGGSGAGVGGTSGAPGGGASGDESGGGTTGGSESSDAGAAGAGGSDPIPDDVMSGAVPDPGRAMAGPLVFQVTAAQVPAVPGQRVLYNVTVGNISTSTVEDVSLLMRVPEGHSFYYTTDAHPNAVGCSTCSPNTEATWSLGSIPPGQTRTVTVNPSVLDTVGDGDSISSVFRLSATGVSPVLVTKTVPVVDAPPVTAALAANLDPVEPGQEVRFTVDMGAIGDGSVPGGSLTLELPATMTAVEISNDGTLVDGAVVWPVEPTPVHTSRHRTVVGRVSDSAVPGDVMNPRVRFVLDGSSTTDAEAQLPISVVLGHPLSFSVTQARYPLVPDSSAPYSITVGNTGEVAVDDAQVVMRVPQGLQFYYTQDSLPDASGCSTCSWAAESFWSLGTIPPGETRTIDVNPIVLTELDDGDLVHTRFQLSASGVNPRSVAQTASANLAPATRLSLTSKNQAVLPGDTFELVCDVGQVGDEPTSDAVLALEFPEGLSVVSDGGGIETSRTVSWELGELDVGASLRRTVTVAVESTVAPGTVLDAQARLLYPGGLDLDGWATLPVTVLESRPIIATILTANPAPLLSGERLTYQATLMNTSRRDVEDVHLVLRTPDELSFYYTTNADPNASGCSTCSGRAEASWDLGTLAAGASKSIVVEPTVNATLATEGSLMVGLFSVQASGVNPYRLSIAQPVADSRESELGLTASTNPLVPGQSFSYDLSVGQVGSAALEGAELSLRLPEGLVVQAISDGGTEAADGSILWDLGTIPIAGTVQRRVDVELAASMAAPTDLLARAELTHQGGLELDAQAEHSVTTTAAALPLEATVDFTPTSIDAGERLLITTTITNTAARAVEGVNLLWRVPEGMSFYYTTDADPDASGCSTCSSGSEASWALGTLAVGESRIVTVNASMSSDLIGGDLVTLRQRLIADGMAAGIHLQRVIPVQ